MIIFNTDLDNTMIYSYKHDIGENKRCVEIYQGREISYITDKTAELLKAVNNAVTLVPTTTRTAEQYGRIDLGIGTPKYALVCNGGILLVDGDEDKAWYEESLSLVGTASVELANAERILEDDINRTLDVRNIRGLFVFTKSSEPLLTVNTLKAKLDTNKVDVFNNGVKVYVLPKRLGKGFAVDRLRRRLGADMVIAAGDSDFDVSMLNTADIAIADKYLSDNSMLRNDVFFMGGNAVYSEQVLKTVLNICIRRINITKL